MSNNDLAIRFFLQLRFIVATCRVVGLLAKRIGQPQVVAEMIAGVLMGPSLLGLFFPGMQGYLFPKASMSIIYAVSQVGLVLYMFLIGLEFQVDLIKQRLRSAATVSVAGILLPFALGVIISTFLARNHSFFTEGVAAWEAALFLGAAMSITAFPMLARIIYERGLTGTSLGTLALAAGSIGDAGAWCVLAIVLASFGAGPMVAVKAIAGGTAYGIFVLTIGRRLLVRLGAATERAGKPTPGLLAITLMFFMLAVSTTDPTWIHAVFCGFLLGIANPRGLFPRDLHLQ